MADPTGTRKTLAPRPNNNSNYNYGSDSSNSSNSSNASAPGMAAYVQTIDPVEDFMAIGGDTSSSRPTQHSQPQLVTNTGMEIEASQSLPSSSNSSANRAADKSLNSADDCEDWTKEAPTEGELAARDKKVMSMIAKAASEQDVVPLSIAAGDEDIAIKGLLAGTRWTKAWLEFKEPLRPNFLLKLEDGLRAAGLKKTIALKYSGLSRPEKQLLLRSSDAIEFAYLDLRESQQASASLPSLLSSVNPQLKSFVWSGVSNTNGLVKSLQRGSHELAYLALTPVPNDIPALKTMLSLKKKLDVLVLGDGKFTTPDTNLPNILATTSLSLLRLVCCDLSSEGLKGCSQIFRGPSIKTLHLVNVKFGMKTDDPSFVEFANGLRSAIHLKLLCFGEFGKSDADRELLAAFAKNPAAAILYNEYESYSNDLPTLLAGLNKSRQKDGLKEIQLLTSSASAEDLRL